MENIALEVLPTKTNRNMNKNKQETATIEIIENGPLKVTGKICLNDQSSGTIKEVTEIYLCRCGKSATKPLCDGSHRG